MLSVTMFAAQKWSIRTKLVRMMVTLLLIVGGMTLVVVAAMNYASSRDTLSIIESNLRGSIQRKGSDLVESQALALRDLVADNAFGDVGRMVDRTVEQDDRIVYGLFLGPDLKPWRFAYRGAQGQRNSEDWKALGVDVTGLKSRGVAIRATTFKGQTAFEFSTPVLDDKAEFAGSVRYAISDRRLRKLWQARRRPPARRCSRRSRCWCCSPRARLGSGCCSPGGRRPA